MPNFNFTGNYTAFKGLAFRVTMSYPGNWEGASFVGGVGSPTGRVGAWGFANPTYFPAIDRTQIDFFITPEVSQSIATNSSGYSYDIVARFPSQNPVLMLRGVISFLGVSSNLAVIGVGSSAGITPNLKLKIMINGDVSVDGVSGFTSALVDDAITTHNADPQAHGGNTLKVTSLNGLSNAVTLAQGSNVSISSSGGNTITVGVPSLPWSSITSVPTASGSQSGLMSASDYSKLAGVEPGASADQSAEEITALLESADPPNRYVTQNRGDARYQPLSSNLTGLSAVSGAGVPSRSNQGTWSIIALGTASQSNVEDFASSAQGAAADSALTLAVNALPASSLGVTVQPYSPRLEEIAALTPDINQIIKWNGTAWVASNETGGGGGGGVSDHGQLTGLGDDDHVQYFNQSRGDARYQLLDADLTAIASLNATGYLQRTGTDTWVLSTLGTASQSNATEFATASQGTKADSALQPSAIGVSVLNYTENLVNLSDVVASGFVRKTGVTTWESSPLIEADIPSTITRNTALTAHTNNTSNPHATTASQVGALSVSNNLGDLSNVTTARTNLGLGTAATQSTGTFLQTANNLSDVTAATARTNLGLGIGTNVQAYSTRLDDISGLIATNGNVIRGNGTNWTSATLTASDVGAQATNANLSAIAGISTTGFYRRTGVGTATAASLVAGDIPDLSSLYQPLDADLTVISGLSTTGWLQRTGANTWSLGTPTASQVGALSTANNLSDLANATTARTNLGVAIGTNVQAYSALLASIAGLTPTNGNVVAGNGSSFVMANPGLIGVYRTASASLTGTTTETTVATITIPANAIQNGDILRIQYSTSSRGGTNVGTKQARLRLIQGVLNRTLHVSSAETAQNTSSRDIYFESGQVISTSSNGSGQQGSNGNAANIDTFVYSDSSTISATIQPSSSSETWWVNLFFVLHYRPNA